MSMAHINALFAPRPAMPFQPPYHQQLGVKKMPAYTGIAAYLKEFESKEENDKNFETFKPIEQRKERRERIAEERTTMMKETLELKTANWNPQDYSFESDAYKTLFVGRLSFLTDEIKLKREFEQYGPVKSIQFVEDKNTGKPRGYAFVEFEHERDMKMAYKHSDGRKIDGRRILVDVERGRTVKDWKPRKLGGGLGSSRKTKAKQTLAEKKAAARMNARSSGSSRPSSSYASGGGDRGGYGSSRGGESRGGYGESRSVDTGGSRGGDRGDRGGYGSSSRSGGGDSRRSGEDYRGSSRGDDRRDGGGYSDYYRGGGGGDRRDRY